MGERIVFGQIMLEQLNGHMEKLNLRPILTSQLSQGQLKTDHKTYIIGKIIKCFNEQGKFLHGLS